MLDELSREEELSVDQAELSAYVTRQAEQMGVAPERLAQQLADEGRLSFAAAEVLRSKAMNLIAERVKVTDTAGHEIDVAAALNAPIPGAETAVADETDDETGDDAETDDDETDEESAAADESAAMARRRRGRRSRRGRLGLRPRLRHRVRRPRGAHIIVKGLLLYGVLASSRSRSRSRGEAGDAYRAPVANRALRGTNGFRAGVMVLTMTPHATGTGEVSVTQPLWTPTPPSIVAAGEPPVQPFADQLFQRLLRHRIIVLGQQVDEDIANRICAELILLASEDDKRDISIYINSPGGSVYAGMAIYDIMQFVPNDVATYAMGMAASMGQFLLTAGARASGTPCRTPRS